MVLLLLLLMPLLLVLFWEKQSLRASILNPFCISIFVIAAESACCSSLRRFKSRCFCRPASPCEWWHQHCLYFPSIFKSGHVEGVKQGGSVNPFRKQGELNQARYYLHIVLAAAAQTINSMTDTTTFISTYLKGFRFESRQSIVKANLPVWRGQRESMGNTSCAKIELSWFLYLHYITKWCRHFKNEYTLQRLRKTDLFMIFFNNQYG